jgi:hypothetical protein
MKFTVICAEVDEMSVTAGLWHEVIEADSYEELKSKIDALNTDGYYVLEGEPRVL